MSHAKFSDPIRLLLLMCGALQSVTVDFAHAQSTVIDSEPNDTPQNANAISSAAVIAGTMDGGDQDGYRWLVSDEDAGKRWTLQLEGIPGRVTVAEVLRPSYDDEGNITEANRLFSIASRDGTLPIIADNLILDPGEYLLGLAQTGGGTSYRPPVAAASFLEDSIDGSPELTTEAGAYRVKIVEGASIAAGTVPQHLDKDSAHVARLRTETGTFLNSASSVWYRIAIAEADANLRWNVQVQVAVGRVVRAVLTRLDGETLAEGTSDILGKLRFPELALSEGEYFVEVTPIPDAREMPGFVQTINVMEDGQRIEGDEAEPNGYWNHANKINFDNCCTGRIAEYGDKDYFSFDVDEARADSLQAIALESTSEGEFQLCLLDKNGTQIQCRVGAGNIALGNLLLPSGSYGVLVARGSVEDEYRLTFESAGSPVAGQETEPNDIIDYAVGTPSNNRIKGSFDSRGDVDFYRLIIADEAQLWRVQAIGENIGNLAYHDGAGHQSQSLRVPGGQRRARLENLFLLPGVHHISVTGQGASDYTLLARKLGPPDPNAELEPNDDTSRMQLLRIGQTRTGLLAEPQDIDMYRFYLANHDHIGLTVTPPVDGQLQAELFYNAAYSGSPMIKVSGTEGPIVLQDVFPPGDYYLKLIGRKVSDAEYTVALERLDPFSCVSDCEQNESAGSVKPAALPLRLELTFDADTVAAYERVGQEITGQLRMRNEGEIVYQLTLDSMISDARWELEFDRDELTVAPGTEQSAAVAVLVGPDAWAGILVRIGVRASSSNGEFTSTFEDIAVDRDALPVKPTHVWNMPQALQGGMDVARLQFGAVPTSDPEPLYPPENLLQAFDGMINNYSGPEFSNPDDTPLSITVDLAGDESVPVAGFAINPLARPYYHRTPKDVSFQLSIDGNEFQTVLNGEVNTVGVDQFFTLDEAVPAKFARLLIWNNWFQGDDSGYTLGGFKVVAEPGFNPMAGSGLNIADMGLGGHVVWASPWISPGWDNVLLTEKLDNHSVRVGPKRPLEWVIGFNNNRAAQLNAIDWTDWEDASGGTTSIDDMTVSISLDSPTGPWQKIADWSRAESSTSIELQQPVWARFVRFSIAPAEIDRSLRVPDWLRIREHPIGDDYLSVVSEWGYRSRSAFYESTQPVLPRPRLKQRGNESRATAATLNPKATESGLVNLGKQSHWYVPAMPDGHNTLRFALTGDPTMRTELSVTNANDDSVPLRKIESESTTSRHVFEVIIANGDEIFVEVREPPRNVMFLWDTSPSVNPYLPMIYNSLIAYAEDLVPERDAANLLPFGGSTPLLQDWYGEPYLMQMILNDYPRMDSSSSAEFTQHAAANQLEARAGTKAIIMITDAATPRYAPIWDAFRKVRPRVFVMKVASGEGDPLGTEREQDLSQDWASVNGGLYSYLANEGEMEVAFDRAATLLRRPANYSLTMETEYREAPGPGFLRVTSGDGEDSSANAVEMILDASGSMWQKLDGRFRIDIAKDVLTSAMTEHIPPGTPTALRVFGHRKPNACDTNLEIPLRPLDTESAIAIVNSIEPQSLAKTPIGSSLASVSQDLGNIEGAAVVVLVTDGKETCNGDPAVEIKRLQDAGLKVSLNIVGFAIDDDELATQFSEWAAAGGGRYFAANDAEGLDDAMALALAIPFTVYDESGDAVAEGIVGSQQIELEQGVYRVVVETVPQQSFDDVEIVGASDTDLEL